LVSRAKSVAKRMALVTYLFDLFETLFFAEVNPMICPINHREKIYVVDSRPGDYTTAVEETTDVAADFTFFKNGRDALRTNPEDGPSMWVVNVKLSDMSGTDLYTMLRSRGCAVPIFLVGDEYSIEDEITARSSGATVYFTKPVASEWLLAAGHSAT